MVLKTWMRRLPPIAWRDAKLRHWREQNASLRAQLKTNQGSWTPPSRDELITLIRDSGLLDEAWYRSQVHGEEVADPVEHYVDHGMGRELSPHPAFVADYYATVAGGGSASRRSTFAHYLSVGAALGRSPHPCFDARAYRDAYPASARYPGGPLAHFLSKGLPLTEEAGATGASWDDPARFLALARSTAQRARDSHRFDAIVRDQPEFDWEAEAAHKAELRTVALPADPPVVSVVIPTKDRAHLLGATLDSVVTQTYPHWQLIVVDDGSTDGTPELLESYASDARVEVVRHDQARGVAAARNAGLDRATGTYVAYLDSDNTWMPDFLDLMVRHLTRSGDRAAYAMTALVEEGGRNRRLYRGVPFDREFLKVRNYIDCIVLVHERSLLEQTGAFDETLRRNVDWDLFIRLADATDFGFVPVIATQYDVWDERGERITTLEPMAYRFVVRQRSLVDWATSAAEAPQRRAGVVSVVVAASGTDGKVVVAGVERLLETAVGPVEVVVIDAQSPDRDYTVMDFHFTDHPDVHLHRMTDPLTLEVARNYAATLSGGEFVCFLPETIWSEPGWDQALREGLSTDAVVQPLVLTSGGAVWSAGLDYLNTGNWYLPWAGFAGDAPEVRDEREVTAATAAALAVRAEDFFSAGGFDPLLRDDLFGGDLSLRVARHTGRPCTCRPQSVVAWRSDPPEVRTASALMRVRDNQRRERAHWQALGDPHRDLAVTLPGYQLIGFDRQRNTQTAASPLLIHDRPGRPLRWAIKIGAPTVERRTNWGDWHFAESLRESLERLGHEVTIDCKEAWYRPSSYLDDVVLQLRGVSIYEVNPGHTNLAWVISHPDRVSPGELADYDLVFGASPRWCRSISRYLSRPATELLQCTDHRRFHPVPPDRRRAHEVLAVANARGIRASVAAALEAGVVPSVYGLRWQGLLPEGAWQAPYIPNAELPAVYAAAGVVLNDHWDTMRESGILSNRLFDLAACEARVISDHLPEISGVFGDVVLTYTDTAEMGRAIETQLNETPERRAAREELGARVRAEHTFDARADQLSRAVAELRSRDGAPVPAAAK